MKKLLSALLSLMVIVGAGNVYAKLSLGGGTAIGSGAKVDELEKTNRTNVANAIKKQADEYDKKAAEAEKAENKDLAELYKKCSECCKTIAAATESDDKASGATISKAKKDLNDLKKQVSDMEGGAKKPAAAAAPAAKKK
jgi:hypothetical protein